MAGGGANLPVPPTERRRGRFAVTESSTDIPAPPGRRWAGAGLLLAAAVLWSLAGTAVKLAGAGGVEPLAFTGLRSAGAAVAMLPLLGAGARLTGSARPRAGLMAPVAACYTLMVATFIVCSARATAGEAILLQYSAPVFAAVLGRALFGTPVRPAQAAALAASAAGIGVLLWDVWDGAAPGGWVVPALGVASGLGYAGVIVGLDAVDADARRRTGSPANVAAVVLWNNTLAAAVLLPWAGWRGELDLSARTAAVLLLLGVWQMALPYVLFQLGVRRVGPVAAGLIVLVEPVLSPLWAFLKLGEVPPTGVYTGGALILAAVAAGVLTARPRRRVPAGDSPVIGGGPGGDAAA